jgi:hypothetical protein
MDITKRSLVSLLDDYADCCRLYEAYGFDFDTNQYKQKIVKELARRIKG